jgi:hypothetical protein
MFMFTQGTKQQFLCTHKECQIMNSLDQLLPGAQLFLQATNEERKACWHSIPRIGSMAWCQGGPICSVPWTSHVNNKE